MTPQGQDAAKHSSEQRHKNTVQYRTELSPPHSVSTEHYLCCEIVRFALQYCFP
jgi:hypothetical protein